MNQAFKLRFDQMRAGNPTIDTDTTDDDGGRNFYPTSGYGRNVCFSWPDGKRVFLNYAYMIAGELNLTDDKNLIRLDFSSQTVSLYGYCLETLFSALMDQLPRLIAAVDQRYIFAEEKEIVVKIEIEKKA